MKLWILAVLAGLSASYARAEVYVTPKHLLILREGVDEVYGSYIFALQNTGLTPEHFKAPVMLPRETEDFVPQEGLEASELALGQSGNVVIEKDVPPGVHIIGIGFRLGARYGRGVMTLTPPAEIPSFSVLIPRGSGMQVSSALLTPGGPNSAPDPQYVPLINTAPLKAGEVVTLEVTGLPEGRTRIWIVGAVVGAMLLALGGWLAWRTRPKISAEAAGSVLIG